MKNWLYSLLLLLALSTPAAATTVTATVTDPAGNAYANGTVSAALFSSTGNPPSIGGVPMSVILTNPGPFSLNASGAFSIVLASTATIAPAGSVWQFTVCADSVSLGPAVTSVRVCFKSGFLTVITGGSVDISSQLNAAATSLGPTPGGGGGSGIGGLAWSGIVTYPAGAVVSYMGDTYISVGGSNLNHLPTLAMYWTRKVGSPYAGPAQSDLWYDVTYYGAVADCVTDDTAAINAAITAWALGGNAGPIKKLYFPPPTGGGNGGCYRINGHINWPQNAMNHWHTVLMNGSYGFGHNGIMFDLNLDNTGIQANSMYFKCEGGGPPHAFVQGPSCDFATDDDTRTLPMVDLRGSNNLTFEGMVFFANSSAMTEAIISGSWSGHGGGIDNKFVKGGAICSAAVATCVPYRHVAPDSMLDSGFGVQFIDYSFSAPATGTYSATFKNIGGIDLIDTYFGGKGIYIESTIAAGLFRVVGPVFSLTEGLSTPFITFNPTLGKIYGVQIGPWQGTADSVGPQYLMKIPNTAAGTVDNVYITGQGGGAGLVDPAGQCPTGMTVIQVIDQFTPSDTTCAIQSMQNDSTILKQNDGQAGRSALLVPVGGVQINGGTNNDGDHARSKLYVGDRVGSGIPFASLPLSGFNRAWFDADSVGIINFTTHNGGAWGLRASSPNGNQVGVDLDIGSNRTRFIAASNYAMDIYTDRFEAIGTMKWKSGTGFFGTLIHANTADRTASFPDRNINVGENPGTTAGDLAVCSSTATPCPMTRVPAGTGEQYLGMSGGVPAFLTASIVPTVISGTTYTVLQADLNQPIYFTNAGAIAVTLNGPGTYTPGFFFCANSITGAGTVTITATGNINGAATLAIAAKDHACIQTDGATWLAMTATGF